MFLREILSSFRTGVEPSPAHKAPPPALPKDDTAPALVVHGDVIDVIHDIEHRVASGDVTDDDVARVAAMRHLMLQPQLTTALGFPIGERPLFRSKADALDMLTNMVNRSKADRRMRAEITNVRSLLSGHPTDAIDTLRSLALKLAGRRDQNTK